MNNTSKQYCQCVHAFQDQQYGKGVRLCNPTQKSTQDSRTVRCTVCNREHTTKK